MEIHKEINDPNHFSNNFDVSDTDLLELAGGVASSDIDHLTLIIEYLSDCAVKVEVYCTLYKLFRTIDFCKKEIYNSGMRVFNQGEGIGTTLFLNQVKSARENGFTKLSTFAKGKDAYGDWNGAYRWGRVGYTMDKEDQLEFQKLMKRHCRSEETLSELLLSVSGQKLWKIDNFSWYGTFYLNDNSDCMQYLKNYLKIKWIDFDF